MGFLDKSGVSKLWQKISDTFSRQNHTHDYTPEGIVDVEIQESENGNYTPTGTISDLTFTGEQSEISTTGSLIGEISIPEFTGNSIDITGEFTGEEETVNASFIPEGEISAPEISVKVEEKDVITGITLDAPQVDNKISLTHLYNSTTKHVNVKFSNDLTILPPTASITTTKAVSKVEATASAPVFTGTPGTATTKITPKGTISVNPIIPTCTISQPEFTGTANLTGTFTPTGTISKATFTGNSVKMSATFTGTRKPTDPPKNTIKQK